MYVLGLLHVNVTSFSNHFFEILFISIILAARLIKIPALIKLLINAISSANADFTNYMLPRHLLCGLYIFLISSTCSGHFNQAIMICISYLSQRYEIMPLLIILHCCYAKLIIAALIVVYCK